MNFKHGSTPPTPPIHIETGDFLQMSRSLEDEVRWDRGSTGGGGGGSKRRRLLGAHGLLIYAEGVKCVVDATRALVLVAPK